MRGEAAPAARPPITAPNMNFLLRFRSTFHPTINFNKCANNFAYDFNPFLHLSFLIELMTMLPIRVTVLPAEVLSLQHITGAKLLEKWAAFEGIFGAHSTAFEICFHVTTMIKYRLTFRYFCTLSSFECPKKEL